MNIGILLAALGVGAWALLGKKKKASEDVVSPLPKKKPASAQQVSDAAPPKAKYRMVIWTDMDPPPENGRFHQDMASVGIRLARVVKTTPQALLRRWSSVETANVARLLVTDKEPTIVVLAFSRTVGSMLTSLQHPIEEGALYGQFWDANASGLAYRFGKNGIALIAEGGTGDGDASFGASFGSGGPIRVIYFDQWLNQEQPWSELMADSLVSSLINDAIPR
jgi:hypothetical protein